MRTSGCSACRALLRAARHRDVEAAQQRRMQSTASRARRIFSGIQPTGIPHIGNYLGALKQWKKLQDTAEPSDELFFSIVGLHAITVPQEPGKLRQDRRDMLATLLALGLSPERCTIFFQEQVPQHAELAWMLNCLVSLGRLQRMTSWKSRLAGMKGSKEGEADEGKLHLGLLAYPVLQAADVLLYDATEVPVGDDQKQHIELIRDLAATFNSRHSTEFFRAPEHIFTPTSRVQSLTQPSAKMSKSAVNARSRILLTDEPEDIESKIRRAVSDGKYMISYDRDTRPGVSNLIDIYAGLTEKTPAEVLQHLEEQRIDTLGKMKRSLADLIIEKFTPFRAEFSRLQADPGYLSQVEQMGEQKASAVARERMAEIHKLVGLA
ncbi:uncharacterized protein L969DRAFT_93194 [Mixia osmundae IAM 14324]|uniref:Tryptophan--tRNA ligase, mitochondrial n=1 Tax=Mixia osmundae (strain CBS 9802 / IAM 14324 / JCM 22182 / KY 12970) TaxID=764103 RepID=G7E5T8_MIXOS|nr:uncharacterized protein L969DRAFT_93194 [Mixia osmundae IAM 14324]KEI40650.1 hypothetical protein L969DRAFT_93194 [Mixia osmundae IAM 14324]GAA98198.1 hypothetical protein E5Q_04881 [Mixia osmundae IAM 14324]